MKEPKDQKASMPTATNGETCNGSISDSENVRVQNTVISEREKLPVFQAQVELIRALSDSSKSSWVLLGETACGKTTQVPQLIEQAKLARGGIIACTQPRRVAAVSVAKRVALEIGTDLGQLVGYSVRFENCYSDATRIKYMTDGMLLREALVDNDLSAYSWIIIDEVHERSLQSDVLMAIVKSAGDRRKSIGHKLNVMLMSATMDATKFSTYLGDAPVLYVEGRCFPVDIYYAPQAFEDYSHGAMTALLQLHSERPVSDSFLVFLTGQEEIDLFCKSARELSKSLSRQQEKDPLSMYVIPLYAHLPIDLQMKALLPPPPGQRKVVVSTNIAETSLTIDGINVVIDSGRVKIRQYEPTSQLDILKVEFVSQAQAIQRAGRAGRQRPGACYRLYTEAKFSALAQNAKPEILRCNLLTTCLNLLSMGIRRIDCVDFIDKPDNTSISASLDQLRFLGAVNSPQQSLSLAVGLDAGLTPEGKLMSRFPLDPTLSRALLVANKLGCLREAIGAVAMLSIENVFHEPTSQVQRNKQAALKSGDGDHITLLTIFQNYRTALSNHTDKKFCKDACLDSKSLKMACQIADQLTAIAVSELKWTMSSMGETNNEKLRRALAAGLFFKSAILMPEEKGTAYRNVFTSHRAQIHPSSALFQRPNPPTSVIYSELVHSTQTYMRIVSPIDSSWLDELVPASLRWRLAKPSSSVSVSGQSIVPLTAKLSKY